MTIKTTIKKSCTVCGALFIAQSRRQVTCSELCKNKHKSICKMIAAYKKKMLFSFEECPFASGRLPYEVTKNQYYGGYQESYI